MIGSVRKRRPRQRVKRDKAYDMGDVREEAADVRGQAKLASGERRERKVFVLGCINISPSLGVMFRERE